jgi:hypothetical protein
MGKAIRNFKSGISSKDGLPDDLLEDLKLEEEPEESKSKK